MKPSVLLGLCLLLLSGCMSGEKTEVSVRADEQTIREWFAKTIEATTEGDLDLMRSLIAEDAVFFVPFAGTMDRESFAAAATASDPNTEFKLECTIEEIEVTGDRALLTSTLALAMTDRATQVTSRMAGHALSVLERRGETWVVIREANTMVPVPAD